MESWKEYELWNQTDLDQILALLIFCVNLKNLHQHPWASVCFLIYKDNLVTLRSESYFWEKTYSENQESKLKDSSANSRHSKNEKCHYCTFLLYWWWLSNEWCRKALLKAPKWWSNKNMELCLPFSETCITAMRAADSFRSSENSFFPSTLSPFTILGFSYSTTAEYVPWF